MRPLHIGLTGGIGSGKSTVARWLVAQGAALVDTDAIARELTAPHGAALAAITQTFGPGMVGQDGALDRERMRALVFREPAARRRLEAILHPLIGEQARAEAAQAARAGALAVVFDVPLLAESKHWRSQVDRVLVVDCEETTQISRVMTRNGWREDAVRRVITQQASRPLRRSIADAVIYNDALPMQTLQIQVFGLWRHWVRG
ncbi:MAG: dephospho-CoA kinase [Rubrivivax sp.]|jgi:dephospho-CoA kinase